MDTDTSEFSILIRYTKALSTALGYRDMMTRLHSDRVCELAMEIGVRYGLSKDDLAALRVGAAFHDIGKIGIPDHILMKPGRLDGTEWQAMKRHAEIGEKIMLSMELPGCEQAARVIRGHHEHYDGGGYPDGLSGKDIPICARIIAIADSYDAMAVTRSYNRAMKHHAIMDVLHSEAGAKHDPGLMPLFASFIETSPRKAE
ncbi:MAG TPA: HD domain-containing phosphohydrolase [Gallionellaceae bacterium]|nr:HD domain-containing phosphohydrolase [Gallionellaceae bacterium]